MAIRFRWIQWLLPVFAAWAALLSNASAQYSSPLQSSPVAVSANDTRLFNVNPSANTITAFDVTTDAPTIIAEAPVGRDPSSLAVHPDGTRLYVANSFDGTITVMGLPSYKTTNTIAVGAEPMAVCITPNGTLLFVANSSSNSLMAIDTASETIVQTVDLSPYGTAPRAIAITNSGTGDDTVETVFVAMFYGQLRPDRSALHEGQDNQREGRVVAIPIATYQPQVTALGPVADTGFNANGRLAGGTGGETPVAPTNPPNFTATTGCYPNQLAAIALNPANGYAYVVSTAASPNGPFRFNSNAQGLVSVLDPGSSTEILASQGPDPVRRTAPLNMNQGVNLAAFPVNSPRLFHTNPVAMAWKPNGSDAWVVIQNTDLVVRLTVDDGGIPTVGAPVSGSTNNIVRVDLQAVSGGQIVGKGPRGIAINSRGDRAYVYNFISRSISIIDIASATKPAIVGTAQSTQLPAPGTREARALLGAELFFSGRVTDTVSPVPNQRMSQEGWGGCIICHPLGRSDNVTWMFDAGPRQTIPLDGMFNKKNPADQRILNWSAVRDENHDFELNTRGVFNGRGLIEDDRQFLAIGGGTAAGAETPLIEQFQQFTGVVGTTNDLANGAALPPLDTPRRDFAVATLGDDRVFIIGGRSGISSDLVSADAAVLEFNPRTNVLRRRSSNGFTLRHSLGAAAVRTRAGFRIYAIGGYASSSLSAMPVATVEEYNPFTDSWRPAPVAPLPRAVAQFAITVAGGINNAEPLQLIHVISGNTASENFPSLTNATPIQRFQADPSTSGSWTTFNPAGLTLRRSHGAATALRGVTSRVFVIGGLDAAGNVLSTVEEYLAQAGTLVTSPHTPLPAPRTLFGIASTLSSNQIYVVGGRDQTGTDQSTIFELSVAANPPPPGVPGPPGTPSGAWTSRGNLAAPRRWVQLSNPPGVTNFLPFRSAVRDSRQDAIAVWIARNVRSARAPVDANDKAAFRGRVLFGEVGLTVPNMSCATCHGGQKWTRSIVDYGAPPSPEPGLGFGNQRVMGAELRLTSTQGPNPGQFPGVLIDVGTFAIAGRQNETRLNPADIGNTVAPLGPNGFNIPSLLSVHETAPYFYSGLAQTLDEVLDGSKDGNSGMRVHFVKDPKNRPDLIAFLRSIDSTTPTFP